MPSVYGGPALVAYWDLACRFLGITQAPPREIGLRLGAADVAQADALLRSHGVTQGFVVICPFAGGTFEKLDKAWPAFPQFARALLATDRRLWRARGPARRISCASNIPA